MVRSFKWEGDVVKYNPLFLVPHSAVCSFLDSISTYSTMISLLLISSFLIALPFPIVYLISLTTYLCFSKFVPLALSGFNPPIPTSFPVTSQSHYPPTSLAMVTYKKQSSHKYAHLSRKSGSFSSCMYYSNLSLG